MSAVDGSEWLFGAVPDPVAAADFEPYSGDPGYQPASTFRCAGFLGDRISGHQPDITEFGLNRAICKIQTTPGCVPALPAWCRSSAYRLRLR